MFHILLAGKTDEITELKARFEEEKEEMMFTIEGFEEKIRDEQGRGQSSSMPQMYIKVLVTKTNTYDIINSSVHINLL